MNAVSLSDKRCLKLDAASRYEIILVAAPKERWRNCWL